MYALERELMRLLLARKSFLTKLLAHKEKEKLRIKNSEKGRIKVKRVNNTFQYYLCTEPGKHNGKYLKTSEAKTAHDILQKEYNEKLITTAKKELKQIEQYIKDCPPTKLGEAFSMLSEGRRRMIEPVELPDEEYVREWQAVEYEGKEISEDTPEFYTQKGERVRSKSEVIIADMLNKYHIPYRYEYPINVSGMGRVFPDFTALNIRKRKEVYIEHLGLLDSFDYRENAIRKITRYEMDGIMVGEDLILTYETARSPLNVQLLERKIKHALL